MKKILAIISLLLIVIMSGCSEKTQFDEKKPLVQASFYPIYDLTGKIAGDKVNLVSFMPEDKEAHHWEPSAKDMKDLNNTELLVVNGAGMEPWLDKVEKSAPELKVLNLGESVDLIKVEGGAIKGEYKYIGKINFDKAKYSLDFGHTHEKSLRVGFYKLTDSDDKNKLKEIGKKIMSEEGEDIEQKSTFEAESERVYNLEMGHEHGEIFFNIEESGDWVVFADRISGEALSYVFVDKEDEVIKPEVLEADASKESSESFDPHSWLSITNAQIYLDRITEELSNMMPEEKEYFESNRDKYKAQLKTIQEEYEEKFKDIRIDHFVVPHQAYGYICREFGLIQYPLQDLTSMEDPSLKTIQEAMEFCKENEIKTVFYEYGGSKKGAEIIAKEIGGEIAPLSTMEFVSKEQIEKKQDYFDLIKMNLENIYESLR